MNSQLGKVESVGRIFASNFDARIRILHMASYLIRSFTEPPNNRAFRTDMGYKLSKYDSKIMLCV